MASDVVIYIISFFTLWAGSGFIVSSISKLSHRLHIPSFFISFVILGILTSTPEIAVGLSAVASNTPQIFVGNLLGGIPVIFLLVIPLLAIFGGGIRLNHNSNQGSIFLSLLASVAPFLTVLDGKVTNFEGWLLIVSYLVVLFLLNKNNDVSKHNSNLLNIKSYSFWDIAKVFGGAMLVFWSSSVIVTKTIYFSSIYNIAPFYISLIVLALGTNLPEITLAIRSVINKKKDIAFGDYLGSASVNGFLFGIFTLMTKDPIFQVDSFTSMLVLVVLGLTLFFYFAKSNRTITPKEGFILLFLYVAFIAIEIIPGLR